MRNQESSDSLESVGPKLVLIYEVVLKVAFPILLGISGWTFSQLWGHEGRIVTLEVRDGAVQQTLKRIDSKLDEIQRELRRR